MKRVPVVLSFALLVGVALWPSPRLAADAPPSGLTRLLESTLGRFSGKAGIYVKHLATGEEAAVRGDEVFETASTIKLAIAVLAFHLCDQGALDLDARHDFTASDRRSGGVLGNVDLGLRPTYRDVLTQMIIASDNSATDIMIAAVGGKAKLNEFLGQSGFSTIRQIRTTYEVLRLGYERIDSKFVALTPEDVFALAGTGTISGEPALTVRQQELIREVREARRVGKRGGDLRTLEGGVESLFFGAASPREMGRLLEGIERGTLLSKASTGQLRRMMRGQLLGDRKIPRYLTVAVAHKTGESSDVTNDVGMIYARSGTIIIAVYNMGYAGLAGEADDRIAQVARLVVSYFDGAP